MPKANSSAPSVLVDCGEEGARRLKQSGIAGHFVAIEHEHTVTPADLPR